MVFFVMFDFAYGCYIPAGSVSLPERVGLLDSTTFFSAISIVELCADFHKSVWSEVNGTGFDEEIERHFFVSMALNSSFFPYKNAFLVCGSQPEPPYCVGCFFCSQLCCLKVGEKYLPYKTIITLLGTVELSFCMSLVNFVQKFFL